MDKVLRELDDLKSSQTSILKKLSQIEADNINLGVSLLDEKLPDIHEEVDSSITIISVVPRSKQSRVNNVRKGNGKRLRRTFIFINKQQFRC